MKQIGFTHGVLHKIMDVYSKEVIDVYKDFGCKIIEISCMRQGELDRVDNISQYVKDFLRKSIHLPTDIKYQNNPETIKVLKKIEVLYKEINADLALVHPDTVIDWDVFDDYKLNWAIENMDNRKESHKDVDGLKKFFAEHTDWKMVLDLNHCFSNDKSMKLADDFISQFKDRIEEIHLSGYVEYHEPLFQTKQLEILNYCKNVDVPVIIESTFDKVEDVEKEYQYVLNQLNDD